MRLSTYQKNDRARHSPAGPASQASPAGPASPAGAGLEMCRSQVGKMLSRSEAPPAFFWCGSLAVTSRQIGQEIASYRFQLTQQSKPQDDRIIPAEVGRGSFCPGQSALHQRGTNCIGRICTQFVPLVHFCSAKIQKCKCAIETSRGKSVVFVQVWGHAVPTSQKLCCLQSMSTYPEHGLDVQ